MLTNLKSKIAVGGAAAALVLGAGTVAGAAAGVGPFESNDSGRDTPHDISERGTVPDPSTTMPTLGVPVTPPTIDDHGDRDNEVEHENEVENEDDHGNRGPSANSGPGSTDDNSGPGRDGEDDGHSGRG